VARWRWRALGGDSDESARDPLLERVRRIDAQHREDHQRPASAESLRKELRVGAERAGQLVGAVRADQNGRDLGG
jgi:hypothetical protein